MCKELATLSFKELLDYKQECIKKVIKILDEESELSLEIGKIDKEIEIRYEDIGKGIDNDRA